MPDKFTIGDAPKPNFTIGDAPPTDKPIDNTAFLTEIRPHQSDTPMHALEDVFGNIGAGGIGALATLGRLSPWGALADKAMGGKTIYGEAYDALTHPKETGQSLKMAATNIAEHPLENIEAGIGAAGAGAMMAPESTFLDKIPMKGRAINTLNEVANAASDVPVAMTMTDPAVQGFRDFVRTGGRGARVMTKLGKRLETGEPMNFPEARQFYSNVSEASARPGFLRRAIESPSAPKMRYQLGNVRSAMDTDLRGALNPEMAEKYGQGMSEFKNAARLNKGLRIGGAVATEEALRRSGILGKMASHITGQ